MNSEVLRRSNSYAASCLPPIQERPLEWGDRFSGEVIAPWEKENRTYASNAELVGDNVLVEVRDLDDKGDGLRLVKLRDAGTKRFKVR